MGNPLIIKSGALSPESEVLPRIVIRLDPAGPVAAAATLTPATFPARELPMLVSLVLVNVLPSTFVTEYPTDLTSFLIPKAVTNRFVDMTRSFQSNYSWGVGAWAERHLNSRFSGIVRTNYIQKDIDPTIYTEASRTANKWFFKEKHHHIVADVGGRWYVNPNSKVKIFLDVKMGADVFIAIDMYEGNDGKITSSDNFGYNRWQPLALGATGVNWKRFALFIEYNRDLKRATKSGNETSMLRQGLSVKTSFALTNHK
jgi:hypothetical protein